MNCQAARQIRLALDRNVYMQRRHLAGAPPENSYHSQPS